ncbi:MAG: hypothetical protein M3P84_06485, partial [Chloroflexota bacterium]|nr:hypothetical protein [Chloroflexota bacterium]
MIAHEVLIDTLAEARLERLHLTDRDLRHPAPSWAAPPPAESRPWEDRPLASTTGPSLRVRIGRGLLALGAAIAGEDTMDHEAPGHAASSHA